MPKKVTIYHNPQCSKSRAAMAYLQQLDLDITVVEYLKDAPAEKSIEAILKKLNLSAREILRTGESQYKSLQLDKPHSEAELIDLIHHNPILMERPIVVTRHGAAIGRPLTNIIELLEDESD
ncbi:arsenate reductase (glutaredoxin) [Chromatiales bacterium (ex Bugula neritina AB1)]|nr:arsenate reductase (glutaredoxin) [Chromatiales bacterium (ex Bugula neritina AB1)]